jgi:hypothetical protein
MKLNMVFKLGPKVLEFGKMCQNWNHKPTKIEVSKWGLEVLFKMRNRPPPISTHFILCEGKVITSSCLVYYLEGWFSIPSPT